VTETPTSIARAGRAPLRIVATDGKPSITPASRLCLSTIDDHPNLLRGRGIDWGSGSGVLAVAAATETGVEFVLGLELDAAEVATARINAEMNGVADRTGFLVSDSYDPLPNQDVPALEALRGRTRFLIANPPTSIGDDGLGWRRRVLAGALEYLAPEAEVMLQVSRQYGAKRTERLAADVGGFAYNGVLGSTGWVPFDQSRADLQSALSWYVAEESSTGEKYSFLHPHEDREIDATEAQRLDGSPRTQWRMHRFTRLS
jgi:predicted RNA methylase